MTRRALAGRVGVALGTVAAWERGENAPWAGHLAALAAALELTPIELAPLSAAPTLRELRERAGLSQADLAQQLGRHSGGIPLVEHGDVWPRDAAEWAAAIGVNVPTLAEAWETSRAVHY